MEITGAVLWLPALSRPDEFHDAIVADHSARARTAPKLRRCSSRKNFIRG